MWTDARLIVLAGVLSGMGAMASAQSPLSAIDWLSQSVAQPNTAARIVPNEPPVTRSAAVEPITVQPLDAPSPDAVGLLPQSVSGLPATLWGPSDPMDIARRLAAIPTELLPAMQTLLQRILLAELAPPQSNTQPGLVFQARIDSLLQRGALEQAAALLERAGSRSPELFRRAFDIALLTNQEDRGCTQLRTTPGISASFPVRIFCLARTGDWPAAVLTLNTAQALDQITPEDEAIIARFLDPDLFEGAPPLPRPDPITPLRFQMMAAVGEPLPTNTLPLAFAHADRHSSVAWKTRVSATERLVHAGALPANTLLGIYTERKPSASGASWDRIKVMQTLEAAFQARNTDAIAKALPAAWQAMRAADLAEPFADLYSAALLDLPLTGAARQLALRIALLSDLYETAARDLVVDTPFTQFAASLAQGLPQLPPGASPLMGAIVQGFAGPDAELPVSLAALKDSNRLGEALLATIAMMPRDADSDPTDLAAGLRLLRSAGLEDVARRAALQLLVRAQP